MTTITLLKRSLIHGRTGILIIFLLLLNVNGIKVHATDTSPGSYKLRRGDILEINVMQNPEFSVRGALVLPDGNIQYPGLGSIRAAGLTIDEFTLLITDITRQYIVDPMVTVFIQSLPNHVVNIIGYVSRPGQVTIFEPLDLMTVLSKAGGITNVKKCRVITIIRANQEIEVIRVNDLFNTKSKATQLPILYVGDTVYVMEPNTFNWSRLSFFTSLGQIAVYLTYMLRR
jgi:polysaccharide export outer membrane protein